MKIKQGEYTNKYFLKQLKKELKVYKKNGGDFLWGDAQDTELTERVQNSKFTYGVANTYEESTGTTMPKDKVKEQKATSKKALKEEIVTMAVLKRADKSRYKIYRLV